MSNYLDRISIADLPTGESASLYKVVRPEGTEYLITVSRKKYIQQRSKDAILKIFEDLKRNGIEKVEVPKECAESDAETIANNPHKTLTALKLSTLIEFEVIQTLKRHRTAKHARNIRVLRKDIQDREIPTVQEEFVRWLDEVLNELSECQSSKETFRKKLCYFQQCFRHMAISPLAFQKWLKFIPLVDAQIEIRRTTVLVPLVETINRPCMTRKEIDEAFCNQKSIDELYLLGIYLSLGSRSGEAERAFFKHITFDGKVLLDKIQSKTETNKRPAAPLALKLCLKLLGDQDRPILAGDKRRFRPTTATMLILAGVPPLAVSERLGHANMSMVINHYSKKQPEDMKVGQSLAEYLGIGSLSVNGIEIFDGNIYDTFLIQSILVNAKRLLSAEGFENMKNILMDFIRPNPGDKPKIVTSF